MKRKSGGELSTSSPGTKLLVELGLIRKFTTGTDEESTQS
jgi:hypothetical protein